MTTLSLNSLSKREGRKHRRVGRGHGSGRGTYAGRGMKGQKSRTGGRKGLDRLGLSQLIKHTPKQRGFTSHRLPYRGVNLAVLEQNFADGDTVTPAKLALLGFPVRRHKGVKILGKGKIAKKLTVHAHAFSGTALAAITKAGGNVVRLR